MPIKTIPVYFALKSSFLVLIFALVDWKLACFLSLFAIWGYQYVIAAVFRLHTMPGLDLICFQDSNESAANMLSVTMYERLKFEVMQERMKKCITDKPKLRYRIKVILGDYYYEEVPVEEAIDIVFRKIPVECKNEQDIDKFISENINTQIPLNQPQWLIWFQEKFQDKYSISIYKQHHSMCDGVSAIAFHMGQGDTYDLNSLMPIKKVSFFQRLLLNATFMFAYPRLLMRHMLVT